MNNSTCPYCSRSDCALEKARKEKSVFNRPMSPMYAAENSTQSLTLEGSPFTSEQIGKLEALYLGEPSPSLQSYRDMLAPGEAALALESAPVDTAFITTEEPRMTSGGLLEPATDHWFSLENQESRFGLVRPDAMPDEQQAQLRELFLQRPAPKQPQHKLSLEQLKALGFIQDDEPVAIDPSRYATGGLLIPE
jgi:hypothetical protein